MEKRSVIILIVVLILLGILIFISYAFYKYFKSPEKTLGIGASIDSVLLSEDGKTAYIKLKGGSLDKNITKIKFIFQDGEKEYLYETSERAQEISVPYKKSFWDWLFGRQFVGKYEYKIDNNKVEGLEDFKDVENVSVVFIYQEEGKIIETPELDVGTTKTQNQTTTPIGGGDGTDGGTAPLGCVPKTCNNYIESGLCGSVIEDKCGNSLNCGNICGAGYNCIHDKCEFNCVIGENCFYVSVAGRESHNGSLGNEFNLSEAQKFANKSENLGKEITFLLESGNYGAFEDFTSSRSDWITYKADIGQSDVIFTYIDLGRWDGPYNLYLTFDSISIYPGKLYTGNPNYRRGVNVVTAAYLKFKNMKIIGSGYIDRDNSAGIWMQYCSNVEINNVTIYGPPTGTDYEGGFSYGIYSRKSNDVMVTDCNIANCEFGISAWGTNWIVKKNVIHDIDSDGIFGIDCKNCVFEDNDVYNIRIPVYVKDTSGSSYDDVTNTITAGSGTPYTKVKNNDFVRITKNGQKTAFTYYINSSTPTTIVLTSAIGQDYINADLVEVREAYHADGMQLYHAGVPQSEYVRCENITIKNNRFHDLDEQGLFMRFGPQPPNYPWQQTALGMTIENNAIYNVAQLAPCHAMFIDQTENVNIINNTIIGIVNIKIGTKINALTKNIIYLIRIWFEEAGVNVTNEDYNLAYKWWATGESTYVQGQHTIAYDNETKFNALFVDSANGDYNPLMTSVACNGSINPPGVAVGALPCICISNSQCQEVFGSTYSCENEKCVSGIESLSPFAKLWNFIKSILTKKTGKAITGNAVRNVTGV